MTQVKLSYSSDWAYIYDILLCSKALLHSKASKKLKDVMRSISTKLNHRYLLLPELEPEVMKVDPDHIEIVKKIPTFELLKNLFDDIPYKMLGVNCISMTLFTVYYMTGKIISYKYIPGYNLLFPPEEHTLNSYLDFYFKPEYSTVKLK
ncbi:11612_t:CDS:2 [Gigaspora rosea]|nr:11612_t:CDS:2 [Gigaspora rosea]